MPIAPIETVPIETTGLAEEARTRLAALDRHMAGLRGVQATAAADRAAGRIEAEDLRCLAAIEDALADLSVTVDALRAALDIWDEDAHYALQR